MDPSHVDRQENAWTENKEACDYVPTFLNETTLHGARFLTHENKKIRFIWGIFLAGAFGLSCYAIYELSQEYLGRPFTTTITRERKNELDFPAVTICNLNKISKSSYAKATRASTASETNSTDEQLNKAIQMTMAIMQSPDIKNLSNKTQIFFKNMNESEFYHKEDNTTLRLAKDYSHTIEGMLSLSWMTPCLWQGEPCAADNFTSFVGMKVGQCFTFNSGDTGHPKLNSSIPGAFNGLKLRLNLESEDHVTELKSTMSGFKISLQHQNDYPLVEEFGFALQPGTHTYAAVRMKKFENLKAPYKTACRSPELHFAKAYSKSYSVYACNLQCFQEYVVDVCKCQPLLQVIPGDRVCSLKDTFSCVYPKIYGPFPKSLVDCVRACPEPCEYYQYDVKLSYSAAVNDAFIKTFPTNTISAKDNPEDFLKFNKMTEAEKKEYFMKNVVSVDIYFEEISYELSKQNEAMTMQSLFGTIGGYLGLFLGMSILTVLEFVDFLFFWIFKIRSEVKNKVATLNS